MLAAVLSASAMHAAINADYFTRESVLSKGRWVKIKVHENGMHQITDDELRAMGFDDPSAVGVFGYSGVMLNDHRLTDNVPDDLPAVPCARYGDKLVFYGEGDVALRVTRVSTGNSQGDYTSVSRNYYDDCGVYFLSDSQTPLRPAEVGYVDSDAEPLTSSMGMTFYEKELENTSRLGARYFDVDFNDRPLQTFEFTMPGFNGEGAAHINMLLGMRLDSSMQLPVTLPDGSQAMTGKIWSLSSNYFAYSGVSGNFSVNSMAPSADGVYTLSLDFSAMKGTGALDYFSVLYPRDNVMDAGEAQTRYVFPRISAGDRISFAHADAELSYWDCSDPCSPRVFTTALDDVTGRILISSPGDFDVSDTASPHEAVVVAFNPKGELLHVETAGEVASTNLHGSVTPHMLIVAAREFMPQAERLAQAHREADGIDVEVALQDDVYNEFAAGNRHIMAIRRMARMYYERDPEKFRSILLFGAALYDNRGLKEDDREAFFNTYVPIYECEDPSIAGHHSRSYGTDAYVGMLAENTGEFNVLAELMTVNVGRIPATKREQADGYVNKAVRYITNPPVGDYHTRALLMSHHGDSNSHLDDAESLADVIAENSPHIMVFKTYSSLFPFDGNLATPLNRRMQAVLKKGVCFWGYSGHGGPNSIGYQKFLTPDMVRNTDYEVPPFAMFATCRALYFDHKGDNLGSELLFKENGGAIGVIGSLREVYQEHNKTLNLEVGHEYFASADGMRIGDVYKNAFNNIMTEYASIQNHAQLVNNSLCYNFAGDPEIKKAMPSDDIKLTECGGREVLEGQSNEIEGCRSVEITGSLFTPSGDVDKSFSGDVFMSVYNGKRKLRVLNGNAQECQRYVDIDEDVIYEARFKAKEGCFSGTVYLPMPTIVTQSNRVTFYALSEDGKKEGVGYQDNIRIVETAAVEEPGAETVPVISAMYLDDGSFADGDLMAPEVTLYAVIEPNEIGVVGMNALVGKSLSLSLDGGSATYADAAGCLQDDGNGGGTLVYPVKNLSDGRHTLTLRVSNYAGQTVSRSVSFEVVNRPAASALTVEEYPATEKATLQLIHGFSDEPRGRVVVKNAAGAVVFTATDASFPYTWNLCNAAGEDVADGVYTVEAYLKGGNRYGAAKSAEVVVNRD